MLALCLAAALVACEEQAPGVALAPSPLPTPATPRPSGVATVRPSLPQPMATPTVKPSTAPGVTPTPVASGGTPAPPTPPVVSQAPTPDGYRRTGRPLDVALSGPGYMVLSTKALPTSVDDLRLTRDGRFRLEKDASVGVATWRLRHDPEGFYVVGFQAEEGVEEAPEEAASGVLTTTWSGLPAPPVGLNLDADRNPSAANEANWDFRGRLLLKGLAPRHAGGRPLVAYLAVAQVAHPDALATQPGFPGLYRPDAPARPLALGVAVSGSNRPIGNAHLFLPATLEIIPGLATPAPAPAFDPNLFLTPSPAPSPDDDPVIF